GTPANLACPGAPQNALKATERLSNRPQRESASHEHLSARRRWPAIGCEGGRDCCKKRVQLQVKSREKLPGIRKMVSAKDSMKKPPAPSEDPVIASCSAGGPGGKSDGSR